MGHGSLSIDPRSQTTYHNTPLNIPLTCRSLYTYTGRPLAHQEQPKLARPPSTRSFVHSMNTVKGSKGSLGFGIGLWSYSRPFLFTYLYTSEIHIYSNGLHVSYGGPLHYTVFGFSEQGGALKQQWAMHINENGSSSYVRSKKRCIFWEDISIRKFLTLSQLYLIFFFKGWLAMRGDSIIWCDMIYKRIFLFCIVFVFERSIS